MTVALSTKNPYYAGRETDWVIMRDAFSGERTIKDKGQAYLPPTTTMLREGMSYGANGLAMYDGYKARAVYHELVGPALSAMLGVMHRKDADIELPEKLDSLRKKATFDGQGLQALIQKVTEEQMLMGRIGVMCDIKNGSTSKDLPYFVTYQTEKIINWDSNKTSEDSGPRQTQFVVLDETGMERTAGIAWQNVMKYRVLAVGEDVQDIWNGIASGYQAAEVKNSQDASRAEFFAPTYFGKTLGYIPFAFIGPRDLVPEPDKPPMMPIARICLAIYRTEADYRQALYMQGQDLLVITGQNANDPGDGTGQQVGAFGSIELPIGGTAEYIGTDAQGIGEMRNSIDADERSAAQAGAQLLSERGNEAEAAGALNIRVASRTASLTTGAKTAAAGVEQVLRAAAEWVGADPDKVHVTPNLDFVDDASTAQDLTYLMTGKTMGAPLSKKSIHGWLAKREFTNMTFEEEQAEIEEEGPDLPGLMPGVRGAPGERGAARPAGVGTPPAAPVPGPAPRGAKDAARGAGAGAKKN